MRVSELLSSKSPNTTSGHVVSLPPTAPPIEAAALMQREKVGAVLIREDGGRILGILSERDLTLAIATHGPELFNRSVEELMSINVPTARPGDPVRDLMRIMTERRARHVPVAEGTTVLGVVSIGDVLKSRLAEKALENAVLHDLAGAHLAT
jgi:CBS domain-containing protein